MYSQTIKIKINSILNPTFFGTGNLHNLGINCCALQVKDFWVVTLCSDVVGYQHFGGPCCLHHHHSEDGSSKVLHGIINQKTLTWIFTTTKISITVMFFLVL